MTAVNSLILVGNAHPNDGGNRAFAEISQECGDRPLLHLKWKKFFKNTETDVFRDFKMIPTVENMLDDAILLVAYAICRHPKIFPIVNSMTQEKPLTTRLMTMYQDFTLEQRLDLYAVLKTMDDLPKISWCLFRNSDLNESLINLKEYSIECEVMQSIYSVEYSGFGSNWSVYGNLK
jgi:hypothetical protein